MANLLRCLILALFAASPGLRAAGVPTPLLKVRHPVDWWVVFKFNAASFPGCAGSAKVTCPFGGTPQSYGNFSQQFVYASSANRGLQQGSVCAGDTANDPLGATFAQIYKGKYFFVLWNDQFYGDPIATQSAPAGHSKGALVWNAAGNGFVMQVSTPSWPGSGSSKSPRQTDGNTLGCVADNDVLVSQHFFALKLVKSDVAVVLKALANSSVVTDPTRPELVRNGGPADIQSLVSGLGTVSKSTVATWEALSSGVGLISKPSNMNVPPWQMVSAMLGGEPLRVANWWASPKIPSTAAGAAIGCWDDSLGKPGAVEIATSGVWAGKTFGLTGMAAPDGNHAKIGVSTGLRPYTIFGDMNQQGSLSGPNCGSSQNGRGGLFFVLEDQQLHDAIGSLMAGGTAAAD
jgi:Deoxyribonuclease II